MFMEKKKTIDLFDSFLYFQ